jgi:MFS family permease
MIAWRDRRVDSDDDPTDRPPLAFRVLVGATMVSAFGSYLNMVALNLFVYLSTGSAVQVGVFMALRLGSGFAAGLAGGTIADRLPRRPVMVACDTVQALALLVLLVAPAPAQIGLLPMIAIVGGLLGTTSNVLMRSSVPDLVGPRRRLWANGLMVTGRGIAMALGFATGGVLIGWLGYRWAFGIDAASFLISASVVLLLPLRFPHHRAHAAGQAVAENPGRTGLLSRSRVALAAFAAAPMIAVIVVVRAVDAFGSASHNVGLPVYATIVRPGNPASFAGQFLAVWAVGLIGAHQLIQRRRRRVEYTDPTRNERAFLLGTCVMSGAFVLAFAGVGLPWVLGVALVAGVADGYTEITYTTRVQAEPDPLRGHVFGLTSMAENGGLGLGILVAAALLEAWSPLLVVAVMHGTAILTVTVLVAWKALRHRRPTAMLDQAGRDWPGQPALAIPRPAPQPPLVDLEAAESRS